MSTGAAMRSSPRCTISIAFDVIGVAPPSNQQRRKNARARPAGYGMGSAIACGGPNYILSNTLLACSLPLNLCMTVLRTMDGA